MAPVIKDEKGAPRAINDLTTSLGCHIDSIDQWSKGREMGANGGHSRSTGIIMARFSDSHQIDYYEYGSAF